jgi:hypothetical protein
MEMTQRCINRCGSSRGTINTTDMKRIDNYKADIALRYAGCDAGMTQESRGFPVHEFLRLSASRQ